MAEQDKQVRVRFAPSPTGHLHLGGARTALFNWLFAKHHNGVFILRIEDTDKTRSTVEANKSILEGLQWLGLYWDEGPNAGGKHGPYYQTERLEIYRKYAKKLLEEGKAYHCFCTPEELEKKRKEAEARKEAPRYDGSCRKLSEAEIKKLRASGKPAVLRFRLPPVGETEVQDIVRGKVVFQNELLDDFVIMKSDGFPTYNFAAVIDDHLMEITHIIRGDDHLSNTPRQILLYQELGLTPPAFAHIPMILGEDKTRLSKRHGATSVIDYEDMGYLPEAMVNFLARMGWGHGDQEIFSRDELIKLFTLDAVSKNAAIFNQEKLLWLNGQYIRQALPERIVDLSMPYLMEKFPQVKDLEKSKDGARHFLKIVACLQDRIKLIPDVAELASYFFSEEFEYDGEAEKKYFKGRETADLLSKLSEKLSALKTFDHEHLEKTFKGLAKDLNAKLGAVIHPTRLALTGRAVSPGIYDVVEILGKEETLKRIEKAITYLGK